MTLASWLNAALGGWLIVAPSVLRYRSPTASDNDVIVGMALVLLGLISATIAARHTWAARVNLALGIWLLAAPSILAYGPVHDRAIANDLIIGGLVSICSAIRIATARAVVRSS